MVLVVDNINLQVCAVERTQHAVDFEARGKEGGVCHASSWKGMESEKVYGKDQSCALWTSKWLAVVQSLSMLAEIMQIHDCADSMTDH